MILITALLLLTFVVLGFAAADLRLINKLRQQRASANAMPSLQTLLDRAPVAGLATENAALNRRLHQLEKKLELFEAEPRASLPLSEIRAMGTDAFPAASTRAGGGGEPVPGAFQNGSARVSITTEEILFLTAECSDALDARSARSNSISEAESLRLKAYFPANRDLLEHADAPDELAHFARSAVIRALRLEGFSINSESAADEFLAKFITSGQFPVPPHTRNLRSLLARELMSYIAAHPLRKVRGRGDAFPFAREVPGSTRSTTEAAPPVLAALPQDGSSMPSAPWVTPQAAGSTVPPQLAAPSPRPAPMSKPRSTRRPAPPGPLAPPTAQAAANASSVPPSNAPEATAPPALSPNATRPKRRSAQGRKKKAKTE